MGSFNFNPSFSGKAASELNSRKESIKNKEIDWNYKQFAWFELQSIAGPSLSSLDDNESIFAARPQGGFKVGTLDPPNEAEYVSDKTGAPLYVTNPQIAGSTTNYLDSLYDGNDPRAFKPILSSATITSNGGEDIYNSYISEVTVNFKVFTLSQLSTVERDLFSLGAKAKVSYGWLGRTGTANRGSLTIKIFNFGYTMGSDGSFDCNIKGLTEGIFMGAESISQVVKLNEDEQDALGSAIAGSATLPLALKAISYAAFGLRDEGDEPDGGTPIEKLKEKLIELLKNKKLKGLDIGQMISQVKDGYKFYGSLFRKKINEEDEEGTIVGIRYISFGDLIKFINKRLVTSGTRTQKFKFHSASSVTKIANQTGVTQLYGSADPTQFIFPNLMAEYGAVLGGSKVTNTDGKTEPSNFSKIVPSEYDIENILISIDTISEVYESLSGKRKDEKPLPPTMVKFIEGLSSRIFRLSGGLVDIKTTSRQLTKTDQNGNETGIAGATFVDNSETLEEYDIFNNTEAQKQSPPTPYEFSILGNDSIVKSYKLDSDFDVDTMLMMTVGRVKKGDFNLAPLTKLYPELSGLSADSKQSATTLIDTFKISLYLAGAGMSIAITEEKKLLYPKLGINSFGIDNKKISTLADNMRDQLTTKNNSNGIFQSLPFYLKLGVTIDGVSGIGFLQPITIDRLPRKYTSRNGVRFLVTSIEHSFDGQGGWETSLDTVMKVGV